ncbi:MAG: xanthine dehydrogenase family protein molybdopterin-binding subunit, partial [Pseudomonadales bacterium]|nr:xanthine dehydrogenase family protein molybdopterin-binding subunit [Pseudomonadales bacterium]
MISRRSFLIGSGLAGGGLILGFSLKGKGPIPHTIEGSFQPNAWLQITADGRMIFQLDKVEMGQGVMTTLPAILAEELDVDPARLEVEMAGVYPDFRNTAMHMQITGGSTSVATGWQPLREAGAAARAILVATAAKAWGVRAEQCTTDNGVVTNTSTRETLSYADLVEAAKNSKVPGEVRLKEKSEFKWLGKSLPRRDALAKSTGTATFGVDVDLPGMRVAVIVRCPHFGGSLLSFDDSAAKQVKGVEHVFVMHSGVAIVADTYWHARKAADKLVVKWNKGPLAGLDSKKIREEHKRVLANNEPVSVVAEGDVSAAYADAKKVLDVQYGAPYYHHSPMEPQNCTALVEGDHCTLWAPSQTADIARGVAAHFTGLKHANIVVNTTLMGGGFGRRGYVDFVGEAAAIALNVPGVPVKLMWSREDDMQHDYYRPATYHGLKGAVDAQGNITAWEHTAIATSVFEGFGADMFSALLPTWVPTEIARGMGRWTGQKSIDYDTSMSEGTVIPYTVPNKKIGRSYYDPGIPTGFWRSVGHSFNAFAVEGFIDELAHLAEKDPVDFRLALLNNHPRHSAVLKLAAEKAGWQSGSEKRGVAVHESFLSYAAHIVEVEVKGREYRVKKVV